MILHAAIFIDKVLNGDCGMYYHVCLTEKPYYIAIVSFVLVMAADYILNTWQNLQNCRFLV